MSDLAEFLLARIAEDEATARAARWHQVDYNRTENQAHGFRWDPARVLAECEAKRRIVTESADLIEGAEVADWFTIAQHVSPMNWEQGSLYTLQLLALPYADHDDYREEWRP